MIDIYNLCWVPETEWSPSHQCPKRVSPEDDRVGVGVVPSNYEAAEDFSIGALSGRRSGDEKMAGGEAWRTLA